MVNMDVLEHRWLTRIAATALGGPFYDRGALQIMTFPFGIHSPEPWFSSESVDNGETPSFKKFRDKFRNMFRYGQTTPKNHKNRAHSLCLIS